MVSMAGRLSKSLLSDGRDAVVAMGACCLDDHLERGGLGCIYANPWSIDTIPMVRLQRSEAHGKVKVKPRVETLPGSTSIQGVWSGRVQRERAWRDVESSGTACQRRQTLRTLPNERWNVFW